MGEYRAFFFNQQKHIEPREDFEASDDEVALAHARQWVEEGTLVEVWSQGLFVGIVRTKTPPASRGPRILSRRFAWGEAKKEDPS